MATLLCSALLWFSATSSFNLDINILELLPEDQQDPVADRAFTVFSDRGMRNLVFLASNKDRVVARESAVALADTLRPSPYIERVRLRLSEEEQGSIAEFAFNNRFLLLHEQEAQLLREGQFESFGQFTLQQLFAPVSAGLPDLLSSDPFLLSYRYGLSAREQALTSFVLDDGFRIYEQSGNQYILVEARLKGDPFEQAVQVDILSRLTELEKKWRGQEDGTRLLRIGSLFYADYAYQTARHEITLIGSASLLLIIGLFLLCFFSLRPILMVMLSLGFGMAMGFTLVRLLFGQVHVLTLVFGASLLGVAVDYAFHYFTIPAPASGDERLRRIFPAITLGLVSSLIGYFALATTPFPGLRQMAVFCIAGLVGAWLTIVLLYPFIGLRISQSSWMIALCRRFLVMGESAMAKRLFLLSLIIPAIVLFLILSGEKPVHDVRDFQARSNALMDEETELLSVFDSPASNQFYIVTGDTPQTVLENMEQADAALQEMKEQGFFENYQSLSTWLPSLKRQQENHALYSQLYNSTALEELVAFGILESEDVSRLRELFDDDKDRRITFREWEQSSLYAQTADFWLGEVSVGSGRSVYAAVIPLMGIKNLEALQDIAPDVVFVDKVSTVNSMMDEYQGRAAWLLLAAAGGIYLMLSWRYSFRHSTLLIALPLISVSTAWLGLVLLGNAVNLFNTLALFLIVGISVDFGIFFAEAKSLYPHTLLAIVLSALTTLFSFGMLSLSTTPVISSFGLTLLIGILTALLFTPVIGNLIQHGKWINEK